MSFQIYLDSLQPKALQSACIECTECQRIYNKDLKYYNTEINKSLKIKNIESHQFIVVQIYATDKTTFNFTIETQNKQRVKIQMNQKYVYEKKLNVIKQSLILPQCYIQLQIEINQLCDLIKQVKELEICNSKVIKIFSSNEVVFPTIFINDYFKYNYPTYEFQQNKQLLPPIQMHNMIYDKFIFNLLCQKNHNIVYSNLEKYCTYNKCKIQQQQIDQLLQIQQSFNFIQDLNTTKQNKHQEEIGSSQVKQEMKGETQLVKQIPQNNKSSVNKKKTIESAKPTTKKPIKTYQEFCQYQNNDIEENSNDYEFELQDLNLEKHIVDIQYDIQQIYQQEDGKDGQNPRLLTPFKIKGKRYSQQKLLNVKMQVKGRGNYAGDFSEMVQEYQEQEQNKQKIEEGKILLQQEKQEQIERLQNMEISDDLDDNLEDLIKNELNLQEQCENYSFHKFINQQKDTVIREYLIDELTQDEKQYMKQKLLSGEYQLANNQLGIKFGIVYDYVQKKFYELEDSDSL